MSLPFVFLVYDLLFKNCFIPQKILTNIFQLGQIFFGNTHYKCVAIISLLPNLKCVLLRLVSIVFYVQKNCSVYKSVIGLPVLLRRIIPFLQIPFTSFYSWYFTKVSLGELLEFGCIASSEVTGKVCNEFALTETWCLQRKHSTFVSLQSCVTINLVHMLF